MGADRMAFRENDLGILLNPGKPQFVRVVKI